MTTLLKVTDQTPTTFFFADEGIQFDDGSESNVVYWEPKIVLISKFKLQMKEIYGGYIRVNLGNIAFSPDAMGWPPPYKISVELKYVKDNGDLLKGGNGILIEATGILQKIERDEILYQMYTKEIKVDLLDAAPNFTDVTPTIEDRVFPRAFGFVNMKTCLQLDEDGSLLPKFDKASIALTTPDPTGDPTVSTSNYNIYDDGAVKTGGTITDGGDGTFESETNIVGEVRITGTGEFTTLTEIFTWATARINTELGTSFTLDVTDAVGSRVISHFADTQRNLMDFLSDISSWHNHYYYIDSINETIVLGDMEKSGGATYDGASALTVTENDIFKPSYTYRPPLQNVSSSWVVKTAVNDGRGFPVVIDDEKKQLLEFDITWGNEKSIKPFEINTTAVKASLTKLATTLTRPYVEVPLTIEQADDIVFGQKITYTDTALPSDTTIDLRVRNMEYSFGKQISITVQGELIE